MNNCNNKQGLMSTCSREAPLFLSLPKRAHVDWNWPISREKKKQKIGWSVKMPLCWLIMGIAGTLSWAPENTLCVHHVCGRCRLIALLRELYIKSERFLEPRLLTFYFFQ